MNQKQQSIGIAVKAKIIHALAPILQNGGVNFIPEPNIRGKSLALSQYVKSHGGSVIALQLESHHDLLQQKGALSA